MKRSRIDDISNRKTKKQRNTYIFNSNTSIENEILSLRFENARLNRTLQKLEETKNNFNTRLKCVKDNYDIKIAQMEGHFKYELSKQAIEFRNKYDLEVHQIKQYYETKINNLTEKNVPSFYYS